MNKMLVKKYIFEYNVHIKENVRLVALKINAKENVR